MDKLIADQQNPSSPRFRKWITPKQFGERFGMSQGDLNKVTAWLQAQGLTVTRTANSRNQIFFDGTVAQVQSAFQTEIHYYLVDGDLHYANATEPKVPASLSGIALAVLHLNNFQPKAHSVAFPVPYTGAGEKHERIGIGSAEGNGGDPSSHSPLFTSHVSGNHFLSPGDVATIYNIGPLYTAGFTGAGQTIAIAGQSSVLLSDIAAFRSAAGLSANAPTLTQLPSSGTSTRCPGDELESDENIEWAGGVATDATILLVYAGLESGDSCTNRTFSVFDSLSYIIDNNLAPVINFSYGNCELNIGLSNAQAEQLQIQQANMQGETVLSGTGNAGAADCDAGSTSATQGFQVDFPGDIPEVTGLGGTEFFGDADACPTGTCSGDAPDDPPYWSGTTGGVDTVSSAMNPVGPGGFQEEIFNDTTNASNKSHFILASGGGASTFFTKPLWQTGTGVPDDGQRDVPDVSLEGSIYHDAYLFCSEDNGTTTTVLSCTSGFRNPANLLNTIGGTSTSAPPFAGIVALINQKMGTTGLGNINPALYTLAASTPLAFHDVVTGDNMVPCSIGTSGCPASSPFQFGFSAGVGYDQASGLGSVDATVLADNWPSNLPSTTTTISPSATTVNQGDNVTFTATVTPSTATGTVSFYDNGSTTALGTGTLAEGVATFSTTTLPVGSNSVVATYGGDANDAGSSSSATVVTVNGTGADFTITTSVDLAPNPVIAGQPTTATLTITPLNGSTQTISFSCTAGRAYGRNLQRFERHSRRHRSSERHFDRNYLGQHGAGYVGDHRYRNPR